MCNCNEHTAEVRRAKCWAVTWLVFSILITLSGFSNFFQGIVTLGSSPLLTTSAGISIIGGIVGIASTSIASCCIPNVPQSPEQLPATKKALHTSFVLQIAAVGIFIVATIIAIIGTLQVVQCANNPCPDFTGALFTPRAMPAGCVDSACKEKDFPQPGWQTDTDCTALTMGSDCASGYNVYKATESSLAWDGGFCASRTCCSTSATPPAGYVAIAKHTCPVNDPALGCSVKWACQAILPLLYGSLGFTVLLFGLGITYLITLKSAIGSFRKVAGPAI